MKTPTNWISTFALAAAVFAPAQGWSQSVALAQRPEGSTLPAMERAARLDLSETPLAEALVLLYEASEVPISFSPSLLPDRVVSCPCGTLTVGEALAHMLEGTPFHYREMEGHVVVYSSGLSHDEVEPGTVFDRLALESSRPRALLASVSLPLRRLFPMPLSREVIGSVGGRVIDATTGQGIEGVSVYLDGTGRGTVSGSAGRYRLDALPAGRHTLVSSMIGYAEERAEITVVDDETVTADIRLLREAVALDELVVTGSIVETRVRELASPITTITAEEIENLPITRLDELFRGTVPGTMTFDRGPYNYYAAVQVRGQNSLYFASIKTYVDGVEVTDPLYIATIDLNSIERIEILRGPQASTIYGTDASGGVMQIFTKKGQETPRPRVSVKASAGVIQSDYAEEGAIIQQDHAVNVSGGGEDFSYNLGGSYFSYGEYIPEGDTDNYSLYGSARINHGDFRADFNGRFYTKDYGWPQSPVLKAAGYAPWQVPRYRQHFQKARMVGANLHYNVADRWTHQLTLGYDTNVGENYTYERRRTTPADTFFSVAYAPSYKSSVRYHNNVAFELSDDVETTVTTGVDHSQYSQGGFSATTADTPFGIISTATAPFLSRNEYSNTGYFAQAKVGLYDRLYLTGGLRADENENFGGDIARAWAPRVGAAYSFNVAGDVGVKARAGWGRAISAPEPHHRSGFTSGPYTYRGNPDIGPEAQEGWDAGLEFFFGRRGSFNMTYYDQTAIDLIDFVALDVENFMYQYQNVGEIENSGWELEGALNLQPFSLHGTLTTMTSVVRQLSPTYAGTLQVGDDLLEIPDYTVGLTGTYAHDRGSINLSMTHMGPWMGTDWVSLYGFYYGGHEYRGSQRAYWMEYDRFTKLSMSADYAMSDGVEAFMNVSNLTDLQIAERSNTTITAGRTTMFGVRFVF